MKYRLFHSLGRETGLEENGRAISSMHEEESSGRSSNRVIRLYCLVSEMLYF